MQPFDLLLSDIRELVTVDPVRATQDNPLGRIANAAIGMRDGLVAWIGEQISLPGDSFTSAKEILSAHGAVVMPGLVDSHTHLVFGGTREQEFARRLAGVPYMQIAQEGGGINATVRQTRASSLDELVGRGAAWAREMLTFGVTTVESKSGYGLDTKTELKQLSALEQVAQLVPVDIVPTFLGAHEFPTEYRERRDAYVDLVIGEMLPAVAEQGIAKICDVFCEEGVFSIDQTRRILIKARDLGLGLRFHADEFVYTGGAELAVALGALAADHLTAITDDGIAALSGSDVCACVLPGTSYYLGHGHYAPARKLLDAGATLVVASDFNPGSCVIHNLAMVAGIAVTQMKLTLEEIIPAVTRNAAKSLGLQSVGYLAKGMQADLQILDIPKPEYLIYHQGRNHVATVIKRGQVVWTSSSPKVFI
jgi:imidazolonepropionase